VLIEIGWDRAVRKSQMARARKASRSSARRTRTNRRERRLQSVGGLEQETTNAEFRWNHQGDEVLLTGSFTDWKNHIRMEKIEDEFKYIMVPTV